MEATSVHLHICLHGFIVFFYTVCALLLFGNNKLDVTEWNMLRDSFGAIGINETSEVELRWSCLETELERQVTWFEQRRDRGYTG